jgi:thiamine-phosphate pyrophosphorylase
MPAACRLYLITPPLRLADLDVFGPRFAAVLAAGDVASALARVAPGAEGDAKRIVARLSEIAAAADVAVLVENNVRLAPRAGADGAHVAGAGAQLNDALASLHPDRIVGVGQLRLRDEAMSAGEAGADYVMFGEPRPDGWTPPFEETLERVDWWAEIFQTPCVGFAETLEGAQALAAAGADFVALGDAIWRAPSPEAAAAEATRRVALAARTRA